MVIGKIRERSTLLLVLVGGALALFILTDLLTSAGFIRMGRQTQIGEIGGEPIEGQEFERQVNEAIENYKLNFNSTTVDANTQDQIREQTWNQLLRNSVMGGQMDELGILVTSEELFDMVQGNRPHAQVVRAFTNPQTQQFDQQQVIAFLKGLESDPDRKTRWLAFERDIQRLRREEKYSTLVKKGLYVTSAMAKADHVARNTNYTAAMVVKRYATVSDSTIAVTDAELNEYYQKNIKKYEQEASRDIEYVAFKVVPSQEDNEKVLNWATGLVEEFKTTDNDTVFVNRNSDKRYNAMWAGKGKGQTDSVLFSLPKGSVIGPYFENGAYQLAKVVDIKSAPDSVKARHILITPSKAGDAVKAKAKADSILAVLKADRKKFEEMAKTLSEDPGSGAKGGDLGYFAEGMMVQPFNDACFNGKKGDLVLVESQFGQHIIEVMDQKGRSEKRQIARVERAVEAGNKTYQTMFGEADAFMRGLSTDESWETIITEKGYNKRMASNLKENDRVVAGLESPREMIRWAFGAEKGATSDKVFEFGNTFVVAKLTAVREKGTAPLDDVREQVTAAVRMDKKAAQFIEAIAAALNGATEMQAVADKLSEPLEVREGIQFAAVAVPGFGREPALIGTIAALKAGQISKPIKGEQGVYAVQVTGVIDAPATDNYDASKLNLANTYISRVDYEVYESLKKKADIVDNRAKFN
jgi:peptidyl-prolyl cis-trans isomerase D